MRIKDRPQRLPPFPRIHSAALRLFDEFRNDFRQQLQMQSPYKPNTA